MYRRSKPKKLRTEVTAIKEEETPAFEEILLRPDEPLGEDEEDDPPTSSASVADVIGMLEVKMDTSGLYFTFNDNRIDHHHIPCLQDLTSF